MDNSNINKSNSDNNANVSSSVMHNFTEFTSSISIMKLVGICVVAVFLGIGTGYFLAQFSGQKNSVGATNSPVTKSDVVVGKIYGSDDTKTYSDKAEGVLKACGIDGEGQYHLERPGGISQNVYLTSSFVDLSLFINRTVRVWGQTQKAEKAGWLMDAGRVEVIK